jgi:hypothetical protein
VPLNKFRRRPPLPPALELAPPELHALVRDLHAPTHPCIEQGLPLPLASADGGL